MLQKGFIENLQQAPIGVFVLLFLFILPWALLAFTLLLRALSNNPKRP